MIARLKLWARALKADLLALRLAATDPRVPWPAKALAALVAAYAFSPIDLIPDFIPVLGYLDDLIIVPAGIWLALKMIPPPVLEELRERAADKARPVSKAGLALVLSVWLLSGAGAAWFLCRAGS